MTDFGIRVYGPRLHDFRDGWAVMPIPWTTVAHYWRQVDDRIGPAGRVRLYRSLCGVERARGGRLHAYHRGQVPQCSRCTAMRRRARGA